MRPTTATPKGTTAASLFLTALFTFSLCAPGGAAFTAPRNDGTFGRCTPTSATTGTALTFASNLAVQTSGYKVRGTGTASNPYVIHIPGCYGGTITVTGVTVAVVFDSITFWGHHANAFTITNSPNVWLRNIFLNYDMALLSASNSNIRLVQTIDEPMNGGIIGIIDHSRLNITNVVWGNLQGGLVATNSDVRITLSYLAGAASLCTGVLPTFDHYWPGTTNEASTSTNATGYLFDAGVPVPDLVPWSSISSTLDTATKGLEPVASYVSQFAWNLQHTYHALPTSSLTTRIHALALFAGNVTGPVRLLDLSDSTATLLASELSASNRTLVAAGGSVTSIGGMFTCTPYAVTLRRTAWTGAANRFNGVGIVYDLADSLDVATETGPCYPIPGYPNSCAQISTRATTVARAPFLSVCDNLIAVTQPAVLADSTVSLVAANFWQGAPIHASDSATPVGLATGRVFAVPDNLNLVADQAVVGLVCAPGPITSLPLPLVGANPLLYHLLDKNGANVPCFVSSLALCDGSGNQLGVINSPLVNPNTAEVFFLVAVPPASTVAAAVPSDTAIFSFYDIHPLARCTGRGFDYSITIGNFSLSAKYWWDGACHTYRAPIPEPAVYLGITNCVTFILTGPRLDGEVTKSTLTCGDMDNSFCGSDPLPGASTTRIDLPLLGAGAGVATPGASKNTVVINGKTTHVEMSCHPRRIGLNILELPAHTTVLVGLSHPQDQVFLGLHDLMNMDFDMHGVPNADYHVEVQGDVKVEQDIRFQMTAYQDQKLAKSLPTTKFSVDRLRADLYFLGDAYVEAGPIWSPTQLIIKTPPQVAADTSYTYFEVQSPNATRYALDARIGKVTVTSIFVPVPEAGRGSNWYVILDDRVSDPTMNQDYLVVPRGELELLTVTLNQTTPIVLTANYIDGLTMRSGSVLSLAVSTNDLRATSGQFGSLQVTGLHNVSDFRIEKVNNLVMTYSNEHFDFQSVNMDRHGSFLLRLTGLEFTDSVTMKLEKESHGYLDALGDPCVALSYYPHLDVDYNVLGLRGSISFGKIYASEPDSGTFVDPAFTDFVATFAATPATQHSRANGGDLARTPDQPGYTCHIQGGYDA